MEYREENNYPKAFLATGIVLAALMLLCWFIVFQTPPKPIEGTGGIIVNYGTSDKGMGDDYTSTEETSVSPKANHTAPTKVTKVQPTEQKSAVDNSDKKILTQANEDAPTVASNSKKPSPNVATEAKKVAAKPTVNQNALYKGAKPSTGSGGGDGNTNTPGNQGSKSGSTLANNYGPGGNGGGNLNLEQRSFINRPSINNNTNYTGRIVVDIRVDRNGNVIYAKAGAKGTTFFNGALLQKCEDAVRNSRVNASENAPNTQIGTVTFDFKSN